MSNEYRYTDLIEALGYVRDGEQRLADRPPFIGFLISKAAQAIVAQVDADLAQFGLTSRQYGVLLLLSRQDGLTQAALGATLHIDRTTMVKLVDELERLGLVARHRDPNDRRAYALALTARGRGLLPAITQAAIYVEKRALAPLTPNEVQTLFTLLIKLLGTDDAHT